MNDSSYELEMTTECKLLNQTVEDLIARVDDLIIYYEYCCIGVLFCTIWVYTSDEKTKVNT